MSEVETVSEAIYKAMGSEHCSYKSTRRDLAGLYTTGEYVIQGPGENAGIVDLGQGLALALRMESHNHPSAVNPVQGAATGIGGIIRDIITMGARPIALLDNLRFGTNARAAEYLLQGVTDGISYYGNCVGIPVVGGEIYFDQTYNHNPLVNVTCMGLVEKKKIIYGHALTPGNDLIYVGARTGMDGIHGADFASRELSGLEEDKKAVQDGDPFLEKLLVEACCDLAQTDWVEGMQDMGAAGLLCSTTEIAMRGMKRLGTPIGTRVYLDRIPTKAEGMKPWQLLVSESQERMMVVGKREHREKILGIFRHWDLEATVVGEVTGDGNYSLVYTEDGQERVKTFDMQKICGDMYEDWPRNKWQTQGSRYTKASGSVTRSAWQKYDWRVGGRTIKGPNQPGHYALLDLEEIGKELVVSWSSDEGISDLNPRMGIRHAFERTHGYIRNLKATPLGLTNCLNFGYPEQAMGAFGETVEELARVCREREVPVVSGNVSLYNFAAGLNIKPTPVLVMVGLRNKS